MKRCDEFDVLVQRRRLASGVYFFVILVIHGN